MILQYLALLSTEDSNSDIVNSALLSIEDSNSDIAIFSIAQHCYLLKIATVILQYSALLSTEDSTSDITIFSIAIY